MQCVMESIMADFGSQKLMELLVISSNENSPEVSAILKKTQWFWKALAFEETTEKLLIFVWSSSSLLMAFHWCVIIAFLFKLWQYFTAAHSQHMSQRQNCCHFTDNIFKCIFLNENVWTSLKISLKFVPEIQINNIPALHQIMVWHRPHAKTLSELP